jgi:hypothetical protein
VLELAELRKGALKKISGELDLDVQNYQISPLHLLSCPSFAIPSPTMPVFVRSVAPFVRTARSALHQGNSVSPWRALGRQNGASILNGTRTYAAVFERTKPHVNIGM